MTPLTKLSLTILDIKIAEEYANTVSLYQRVTVFIHALYNGVTSRETFESFAWTNYCHHVKKSHRGKTVTGYTCRGEELWRITYKGNRK